MDVGTRVRFGYEYICFERMCCESRTSLFRVFWRMKIFRNLAWDGQRLVNLWAWGGLQYLGFRSIPMCHFGVLRCLYTEPGESFS